MSMLRPRGEGETFWALRDVSFEARHGETLGLIGHNGSGKSTTLKLITRILEPTSGAVRVRGRVSALLELGSGFHPDLTGRENIFLNGSLLGFSRSDMERRVDAIIDFAELGPFIDSPVKHYSSGMYMRLGFAVATAVDPDILITDEVLAVGDEAFQRKCMERIYQHRQDGRTIVFVSHSLEAVRNLCTHAIWLDHGVVQAAGDVTTTLDAYLRWTNRKEQERLQREREEAVAAGLVPAEARDETNAGDEDRLRWGSGEIEIEGVDFLDRRGRPADVFETGGRLTVRIRYNAHRPIEEPVFGLAIHHESGFHINGPNTRFGGLTLGLLEGAGQIDYTIPELPLLAGGYLLTAAVYDRSLAHAFDHHERMYRFVVQTGHVAERFGTVHIPGEWRWTSS